MNFTDRIEHWLEQIVLLLGYVWGACAGIACVGLAAWALAGGDPAQFPIYAAFGGIIGAGLVHWKMAR